MENNGSSRILFTVYSLLQKQVAGKEAGTRGWQCCDIDHLDLKHDTMKSKEESFELSSLKSKTTAAASQPMSKEYWS